MDLYTVDTNWLKTGVVDEFESVVWTERYRDSGEVNLVVAETPANRAFITEGIFLHTPSSQEIMLIDTISIEDGSITATGRTLTDFLKQRIFRKTWQGNVDSWVTSGTLGAGASINVFLQDLINPATYLTGGLVLTSGANEAFTNLTLAPDVSGPAVRLTIPYGDLFTAVQQTADSDDLGFTMYPQSVTDGTGNLYFKVYRGVDRSSGQSTNPLVAFDPAMDSITGIKELRSLSGFKNVAYVWPSGITAQTQIVAVYGPGASSLTRFNRRSMMVTASDVNAADYTSAELITLLTQVGKDALANNNYVRMLDGQLVPQNAFVYGTDYSLGDVIDLRGTTSIAQKARVTEYIRAQDSTGERAYPTLSVIA